MTLLITSLSSSPGRCLVQASVKTVTFQERFKRKLYVLFNDIFNQIFCYLSKLNSDHLLKHGV